MKILLYSHDLNEQDVIDKLFMYLCPYLTQEKYILWLRKHELEIVPSEEACKEFDLKNLRFLLLNYLDKKLRAEIVEILTSFWFKAGEGEDPTVKEEVLDENNEVIKQEEEEVAIEEEGQRIVDAIPLQNISLNDVLEEDEQQDEIDIDAEIPPDEAIGDENYDEYDDYWSGEWSEELKSSQIFKEKQEEENGIVDYLFVELTDTSKKFIDEMLPYLMEIETEMKKLNPDTEVIAAFSDESYDDDAIYGLEIAWNVVSIKL